MQTNRIVTALGLSSFLIALAAQADVDKAIYATGFEPSQGFTAGDINGQNGWATYQPGAGSGYANVTLSAPAGYTGLGAFQLNTGVDGNTSPRYAWPAGYGATFSSHVAGGAIGLYSKVSMLLPGAQTSAARMGVVNFDSTGAKILGGFYVQASTRAIYMLGYYNNSGTLNNYAFNTGVTLASDQWVDFRTAWNRDTGRFTLTWGSNSFYVDGAGAGSTAEETDFYGTRNGSTLGAVSYFDNLEVGSYTVPEPSTAGLLALGIGAMALLRRRQV